MGGGFDKDEQILRGYAWADVYDTYLDFCVLKADPEYEKKGINAAIVYKIVSDYSERLGDSFYICDGARATVHETGFQDYLEKYFEFRKAYCELNMAYPFIIGVFIKLIYPFRRLINAKGKIGSKLSNVLLFEEVSRTSKQRREK